MTRKLGVSRVPRSACAADQQGSSQSYSPVHSWARPTGGGCRLIGTAPLLHSDQLATAGISLLVFDGMSTGLSQPSPPRLPHC